MTERWSTEQDEARMHEALVRLRQAAAAIPVRHTSRLLLRPFEEHDRVPFAALNADPEVAQWLPARLSAEESDRLFDQIVADAASNGFGLFAVQEIGTGPFLGFVGLAVPSWQAHFTPVVEIAWRLARPAWGKGYATEAAREVLAWSFGPLGLPAVWSWTSPRNVRSWRVMERLGMVRVGTFPHPRLPPLSPLSEHEAWRIEAPTTDRLGD